MEENFLNKSKENLKAAELLFKNEFYNASANRAYYAAFHAAIAMLTQNGVALEKISHEGIQANFASELIHKRKIYANAFKSYLAALRIVRENADYKNIQVSKKVAERQLKRSNEFVELLTKR